MKVLDFGTPVIFRNAEERHQAGIIQVVDLNGGGRCINSCTSYDILGEDRVIYKHVPMTEVMQIPVSALSEYLQGERELLLSRVDRLWSRIHYSSSAVYRISSILDSGGRMRLDGRYPLRVGRSVTNILLLDIGYPVYWRYVTASDGKPCSGSFHTSSVRRAELGVGKLVFYTMNSIYTLERIYDILKDHETD